MEYVLTRIGLIGAGNISATHARAISRITDARLVAVYAPRLERAERLASEYAAAAYADLDRFLDSQSFDMVIVGTPSGLHGEHGTAAARRGLHVLVEKPIEITTVRCDALIEETRRSGVTLGVVFQDRMKAAVRELKATITAGALGRVVLARAEVPWWRPPEYYRESRWRGTRELDGGGVLINQAIHTVDLLTWLCGPVARVFGRTATQFHDIEVEDTAVAVLEFASGALGTFDAATCAYPGKARRVEISGSSGTAILEGDDLVSGALSNRGQAPEKAASPVVADVAPHRDVLIDFMRACANGTAPCCDGSEARRSLAVVEAIYRSSRLHAPVQVDTGAAT